MGSDSWSIATILESFDSSEICSSDHILPLSRSDRLIDPRLDDGLVLFCAEEISDAVGLGFANTNNSCSQLSHQGQEKQLLSDDELLGRSWEVESSGDIGHETHTLSGSVTSLYREQDQLSNPSSEIYNNFSATDSEPWFQHQYDASHGIGWSVDFKTDYEWFQDQKYRSEMQWPFCWPCTDGIQTSLAMTNSPFFEYLPHEKSSHLDGQQPNISNNVERPFL